MSRDRACDEGKADFEDSVDKIEIDTSDDVSTWPSPTPPPKAWVNGSNTASEKDLFETCERGRSTDSHLSIDSARSVSDAHGGHDHQVPPHRDRSRARSSNLSVLREAQKVPRSKRRGLLGRFAIIAEVTDPYAYPRSMKWMLTFVVAVAGAAAPMGSSIVLPALHEIAATYHSSATVVNLSISLWMFSMSIFPLWWSSFSETLGRRTIYISSFALYFLFNALSAVATNIVTFLAMRALAGGAAASVQAVGAGTIADIWEVKERGRAMGIFYLGPLCGPLISPIIGGAMTQSLGWRSVAWFLGIYGAVVLVFVILCLPETLVSRKPISAIAQEEETAQIEEQVSEQTDPSDPTVRPILTRTTTKQSVQIKTRKYLGVLRRCFVDPLRIILYVQFPAVAICVAYSSISFCSLYILNISVQQTFSVKPYNYPSIIIGLLYIPNSFGYFVSSILGGRWVDNIMHREARKAGRYDANGKLQFRPEDRMKENAWLGAFIFPAALIVYGWSADYGVTIAVPMIANFFFGAGSMLIFAIATTMLTEFMPRKASNGVALNNFVRNIFSGLGSLLTEPLLEAIGNGWLFTGMGIIALVVGSLTIWAMKRYGDHWRISMDKNMDKVIGD